MGGYAASVSDGACVVLTADICVETDMPLENFVGQRQRLESVLGDTKAVIQAPDVPTVIGFPLLVRVMECNYKLHS